MVAKKEQQGKKIQELYHKMASVQSVGSPSHHHMIFVVVGLVFQKQEWVKIWIWIRIGIRCICPVGRFTIIIISSRRWSYDMVIGSWKRFLIILLDRIGRLSREPVTIWGMRSRSSTARSSYFHSFSFCNTFVFTFNSFAHQRWRTLGWRWRTLRVLWRCKGPWWTSSHLPGYLYPQKFLVWADKQTNKTKSNRSKSHGEKEGKEKKMTETQRAMLEVKNLFQDVHKVWHSNEQNPYLGLFQNSLPCSPTHG